MKDEIGESDCRSTGALIFVCNSWEPYKEIHRNTISLGSRQDVISYQKVLTRCRTWISPRIFPEGGLTPPQSSFRTLHTLLCGSDSGSLKATATRQKTPCNNFMLYIAVRISHIQISLTLRTFSAAAFYLICKHFQTCFFNFMKKCSYRDFLSTRPTGQ